MNHTRTEKEAASILEFLAVRKLRPQDKMTALRAAASCIQESLNTQCKLEMMRQTMINFVQDLEA